MIGALKASTCHHTGGDILSELPGGLCIDQIIIARVLHQRRRAPIVQAKAAQLRERDYTPTFTVDQMRKDVGLILEAGSQLDVPMTLTGRVDEMLQEASAQGDANLDYAGVIRVAERAAGIEVSPS